MPIIKNANTAGHHHQNLVPIHDVREGDEKNNAHGNVQTEMELQINSETVQNGRESTRLLQFAAIHIPILLAQGKNLSPVIGKFNLGHCFNLDELNSRLNGNRFTDNGMMDLLIEKQLKTGIAIIRASGIVTILCYNGMKQTQNYLLPKYLVTRSSLISMLFLCQT